MTFATASLLTLALAADPALRQDKYFKIIVVDEQTGRGVPLVELKTVNNLRYYTDSNGVVAFHEPGLMDQTVFFHVKSHGYEYPKDGFGFRGKALKVVAGGSAKLTIKRLNIAERLYRVTGGGIYADSLLVGERVPLRQPVLNGQVLGSDSVVTAIYRGKLYWFWGDTNRPAYPLGNFHVPGATSKLPADGGLDPELGVDLDYFVNDNGFAKETAKMPGQGPTWIGGLVVLRDGNKTERMFASYVKVRPPLDIYERGLAEFDDEKKAFKQVAVFDKDAPLAPPGHPFHHTVGGREYVYFANPYPLMRVPADPEKLRCLSEYEGFTCLKEGSRLDEAQIDRDGGRVRYAWKKNTPVVGPNEQGKLVQSGKLKQEDLLLHLQDVETGKPVLAGGSVYWNDYRKRWVMIAVQSFGTSFLGEVWYAEADTPLGPWVYARKVVTHDKYSFYNPKQHPYFAKAGGRVIFFEGTYSHTFSGNSDQTPRYDYNQIMYKLDLSDPRLVLPVPFYALGSEADRFGTIHDLKSDQELAPAFFALDRPLKRAVPVYVGEQGLTLSQSGTAPVFHALPVDTAQPPATTTPLYEFIREDGRRMYSTDKDAARPGYRRAEKPLCLVWRNPSRVVLRRE